MRRLLDGAEIDCDVKQRVEAASGFARWCGQVVLLKGAGTLVCDGRRLYTNETGNPGMASGGSGDVLTGLIAALIGQGLVSFEAACLGAYLHGLAGDMAARQLGEVSVMASDLIDQLPGAIARGGLASGT
jgi:ADP-dependent NAD(P)H-hydrate dehydratase